MSTKDTDPQWRPPASARSASETSTEPGADASRLAEELLASLAKAPLPEEGVAETKGHDAAAFAAGPHTPPARARDDTLESEPAVVLNTTQPFGRPVTPDPIPLGTPPPSPAIADDEAKTHPRPRRLLPDTVPSARVARSRRSLLALAAVLGAAGVILVASFVRTGPAAPEPAPSNATRASQVAAATTPAPPPLVASQAPMPIAPQPTSPATIEAAPAARHDPPKKPAATPLLSSPAPSAAAPPRATSSSDFPWRQ